MNRSEMISNIRSALDYTNKHKTEKIDTKPSHGKEYQKVLEPSSSYVATGGNELEQSFILHAQNNGTRILQVDELKNIPYALTSYLTEFSQNKDIIRCMDKVIQNLPWKSAGLYTGNAPPSPDDKIGISIGFSAVAETGTVLLTSSSSNPALLAFLPETHVIILRRTQIKATLEEAFTYLLESYAKKPFPRSVNLISGASRTGDIGGRIIQGAQGPLRVAVVLLTSDN